MDEQYRPRRYGTPVSDRVKNTFPSERTFFIHGLTGMPKFERHRRSICNCFPITLNLALSAFGHFAVRKSNPAQGPSTARGNRIKSTDNRIEDHETAHLVDGRCVADVNRVSAALSCRPARYFAEKLSHPDRPTSQNTFGWDIVTFQDTVFISDPFTPEGGAVYQFGQDGSLLRKIYYPGTFASNSPRFGDAISVVGNHLVVGATFDGASASGSVYVYSALTGSPERQINSPSPAGAFQQFGQSFASSGNQLIIGNSTSSSSFFGEQVATTGNQVFIAAPQESQIGPGAGTGVVHSFDLNSGSFIRTMGGDLNDPHRLGSALAVAGNGLLAGDFDTTHGRAYLFDVNSGNVLRMFDQPAGTDNAWYGTPVTAVGNFDVIASQTFRARRGLFLRHNRPIGANDQFAKSVHKRQLRAKP